MANTPPNSSDEADTEQLNPALKPERDTTYGSDQRGTDPMESVSVQKEEGGAWPWIWAVVTIVCVIITILLVLL